MEAVVEASLERWLSPVFQATSEGQAAARVLRERLLSMDNQAYRHTCAAIAAMDLRPGNRSLSLPTLVIAGRQDLATPPAMSRALVADIAGARLVEVEAAHLSAVECPDRVAGVLHDWLRALPSI